MARVRRQAPNPGAYTDEWDSRVRCAWAECDSPASTLHVAMVECYAAAVIRLGNRPGLPGYWSHGAHTETPDRIMCAECRKVICCSEQHADLYRRSARPGQYGQLSAGVNGRFL